jgi:hypothetical protein
VVVVGEVDIRRWTRTDKCNARYGIRLAVVRSGDHL